MRIVWTVSKDPDAQHGVTVQGLVSTMVHIKLTGAQHQNVVVSKNRTVTFYSVGKIVVLLALFAVQPVVVHSWFTKPGRL